MHVLPHTVQGAEVILESYAQVYYNQFTTGNSPFQLVQWSTVPNNKKNQKMETSLKTGFAQIFSCCPKNLRCPNFGGAAAPLAPPPPLVRTPMRIYTCQLFRSHLVVIGISEYTQLFSEYFQMLPKIPEDVLMIFWRLPNVFPWYIANIGSVATAFSTPEH